MFTCLRDWSSDKETAVSMVSSRYFTTLRTVCTYSQRAQGKVVFFSHSNWFKEIISHILHLQTVFTFIFLNDTMKILNFTFFCNTKAHSKIREKLLQTQLLWTSFFNKAKRHSYLLAIWKLLSYISAEGTWSFKNLRFSFWLLDPPPDRNSPLQPIALL